MGSVTSGNKKIVLTPLFSKIHLENGSLKNVHANCVGPCDFTQRLPLYFVFCRCILPLLDLPLYFDLKFESLWESC